jgi:hypothetical protein
MGKYSIGSLALVAVLVVSASGIAVAEKPTVVRTGNLILNLNGGVKPKRLPKRKLAPIALSASGQITTVDGSQPPPAKEVTIDFDKHGTINAKGLPICRSGKLQARDTNAAMRACPKAIVGKGTTTVRVAFPEQAPFNAKGPLVLFNGGVRGNVTTMFIHAYVSVPTPTALITTVKIKKIHRGPYGTRAMARIPVIAGGSGSVTSFKLTVHRLFKRAGKKQSYLLARCANGHFLAHATVAFAGGGRIAGGVVRACKTRG